MFLQMVVVRVLPMKPTNQAAEHGWAILFQSSPMRSRMYGRTRVVLANIASICKWLSEQERRFNDDTAHQRTRAPRGFVPLQVRCKGEFNVVEEGPGEMPVDSNSSSGSSGSSSSSGVGSGSSVGRGSGDSQDFEAHGFAAAGDAGHQEQAAV